MRKVILLFFIFFSFKSYSQTEAETIEWIVQKIKDFGNTEFQTIISADNNGNITLAYFDWFVETKKHICIFNLKDVITVYTPSPSPFTKNVAGKYFSIITKGNKVHDTFMGKLTYTNSVLLALKYVDKEEKNLFNRFGKALYKLIDYNKAKSNNEPF